VVSTEHRRKALAQRCAALAFEQHAEHRRVGTLRFSLAALLLDPAHPSSRGLLSVAARSVVGSRMVDLASRVRGRRAPESPQQNLEQVRTRIAADPTDPCAHHDLGRHLQRFRQAIPAYACLRTALAMAHLRHEPAPEIQATLAALEVDLGLSPERGEWQPARLAAAGDPYGRLQRLAMELGGSTAPRGLRVLDVGGGNGFLSLLLPGADYVLVEPQVNGLHGDELPFPAETFDAAILCHVLEHVPAADRWRLLDEALRLAERCVLVLGPFSPPAGRAPAEEGILEATGTSWAREHLSHSLPTLEDLRHYLDQQPVQYEVLPHADARVMYWQYLALHFAVLAGEERAAELATAFYQRRFDSRPIDPADPHDFLVRIRLAIKPTPPQACADSSAR
jgi:SAM-dependent methyltransferase